MSYTADYPIHEAYNLEVIAEVEYGIDPGYRGGRDEPSEEASAYVIGATLKKIELKRRWGTLVDGTRVSRDPEVKVTYLGDAPDWVLDLIRNDDDWLSDQASEDGYDATDDLRDRLHDDRMSEAV